MNANTRISRTVAATAGLLLLVAGTAACGNEPAEVAFSDTQTSSDETKSSPFSFGEAAGRTIDYAEYTSGASTNTGTKSGWGTRNRNTDSSNPAGTNSDTGTLDGEYADGPTPGTNSNAGGGNTGHGTGGSSGGNRQSPPTGGNYGGSNPAPQPGGGSGGGGGGGFTPPPINLPNPGMPAPRPTYPTPPSPTPPTAPPPTSPPPTSPPPTTAPASPGEPSFSNPYLVSCTSLGGNSYRWVVGYTVNNHAGWSDYRGVSGASQRSTGTADSGGGTTIHAAIGWASKAGAGYGAGFTSGPLAISTSSCS